MPDSGLESKLSVFAGVIVNGAQLYVSIFYMPLKLINKGNQKAVPRLLNTGPLHSKIQKDKTMIKS